MSVLGRLKNIIKTNVNHFLDEIEEPENSLTHSFHEAEKELEKGYSSLANDLLLEKRLELLITESEKLIQKRVRQAKLAIEHQEDGIAKLAIEEKLLHERNLRSYREQYLAVKTKTSKLYNQLEKLKEQYNELRSRRLFLHNYSDQGVKRVEGESEFTQTEQILEALRRTENLLKKWEDEPKVLKQNVSTTENGTATVPLKEEIEREWTRMKEEQV